MKYKNILIVSATALEIENIFSQVSLNESDAGNVISVKFNNRIIDLLITGPGMVPTSFFMGRLLGTKSYDLIINAGIAGSFNPDFSIGQAVNVVSDCFPELGAENDDRFLPLYSMQMAKLYTKEIFDETGVINNKSFPNLPILNKISKAKGITVNTISGKAETIENLKLNFGPDVESMEGAAFFYACNNSGTACIQIRTISNYVQPKHQSKWNIKAAVSKLHEVITKILDELE